MDMKVIYAVVAFVGMLISSNVSFRPVNAILQKMWRLGEFDYDNIYGKKEI